MINYNGALVSDLQIALDTNRAFLYGDSVFETIKIVDAKILFAEDHYFRLMASMRIVRMEIPMNFTLEYFEDEVVKLAVVHNIQSGCRARISFFRKPGGYYLPVTNDTDFIITAEPLQDAIYKLNELSYEVDLFRDFYITKHLLSSIKTTSRLVNITGSIFANENGLQNCLLLNDDKNVVEALHGNVFMLTRNKLSTPPVSDGCLNGIMRKQVLDLAGKIEGMEVEEVSISPFDLQKADELFITNVIMGIQPITKYRKKGFGNNFASDLITRLNAKIRLD